MPLNGPLKNPRPEGSVLEPSGNVGLRTRVNSFTMNVPFGNFPVSLYALRLRASTYTLWNSGKLACPPFNPFGVSGHPTKTQLRKPVGNFSLPSARNTALEVFS